MNIFDGFCYFGNTSEFRVLEFVIWNLNFNYFVATLHI